jgi:hypothetical protein
MINNYEEIFFNGIKNPTNCEVKIYFLETFYQISINREHFNNLNENTKTELYKYLNNLEETIKELGKKCIMVKVDF